MPKGIPKNGINKGWFKKENRFSERKMRNCLVCQSLFQTYPVFVKRGQGRFCSIPCARKAVSLGLVEHTLSPKARQKMSEMMTGNKFALGKFVGEKSPNWKGNKVGYFALHNWVARKLGKPDTCKHCGRSNLSGRMIHWANKSGKYRRKLNDWLRLCVGCHHKYDYERVS